MHENCQMLDARKLLVTLMSGSGMGILKLIKRLNAGVTKQEVIKGQLSYLNKERWL